MQLQLEARKNSEQNTKRNNKLNVCFPKILNARLKFSHLSPITINSLTKYLPKNNSRTANKKHRIFCRVLLERFQPSGSGDAYGENRSLTALCFMICECMQMLHTRPSTNEQRGREREKKINKKKSLKICFDKFRAILNVFLAEIFFIASTKQARERCTSFNMLQPLSPPKCAVFTFCYLVEQTIAVLHLLINYEWDLTRKSKLNNFLHVT